MVADKSKFDRVSVDPPKYGDVNKSTNLNTSELSSSDESLKSKDETELRSDQSVDSSGKVEFEDDEQRIIKNTYLCDNANSGNVDKIDLKFERDEKFSNLTVVKNADNAVEWKFSTTSCTQNLDITRWSDLNLGNLTIESLVAKESFDDSILARIRKCLADYQELRGTSREEYTFFTLIRVMGQATGRCLFALLYVILNIAPAVLEMFLHIVRFVLDKMVDIKGTLDVQQIVMKTVIFAGQLLCIYICLVFIFGFIVWPVMRLVFGVLAKIMLYD